MQVEEAQQRAAEDRKRRQEEKSVFLVMSVYIKPLLLMSEDQASCAASFHKISEVQIELHRLQQRKGLTVRKHDVTVSFFAVTARMGRLCTKQDPR